jgi:urease accessory protein
LIAKPGVLERAGRDLTMCRIRCMTMIGLAVPNPCEAHGFAGSGWLHPLTGVDHMVAMIAVGAWSAQMGGKALYLVPTAFVVAMAVGGTLGFERLVIPGTEVGIALSVVLLGVAICWERKVVLVLAIAAVALFGVSHGYAHGYEMPVSQDKWSYATGFVITTAGLHVSGAVGALLLLERPKGRQLLRYAGAATALAGLAFCNAL